MTETDPREVVEQALKVHSSLVDFCRLRKRSKFKACVALLVEEILSDQRVISALKCLTEICSAYPERDHDDQRNAAFRDEIINRIQATNRLSSLVIDNLTTYMSRAKRHQEDH